MKSKSSFINSSSALALVIMYLVGYNLVIPRVLGYLYGSGVFPEGNIIPELVCYLTVLAITLNLAMPAIRYGWDRYVDDFGNNIRKLLIFMGLLLFVSMR